jgi:diaminohydroxyphosphoribosylaminopyrimidine deaminase/5-amino-6-(5-phosphoribosylamino)uracil reductase
LRVVVDSHMSLSSNSKLAQTANQYPTLIWTGPGASSGNCETFRRLGVRVHQCTAENQAERLDQLLQFLVREYSATNVLVEGGGQLLGSLFDLRQIDQCEVFIAPKLIGGSGAISPIAGSGILQIPDGPTCYDVSWQPSDRDQHLSCRLRWQ